VADYNARSGKEPRNPKDFHRPLSAGDDLTDIFAWLEERTVSNTLTLGYDKVVFLLEPNKITSELRHKRVTVVDYPDGRLAIRYRELDLPYTTFDKLRQGFPGNHRREQVSRRRPRASARGRSNAPRLAVNPPLVARDRLATCSKSAEAGSRRHTGSTAMSRCQFSVAAVTP